MKIVIKNCNNIDEAHISLEPNCLNIKYGANGTGKSTIAQAISLRAAADPNLSVLLPFKYRPEHAVKQQPSIEGLTALINVIVFNEGYVNQFVFQRDEIVRNSFDIFIRNVEYDARMKEIEILVTELRETFTKTQNIDQVINDLSELSDSFGKSQTGFSQASRIGKGLKGGNKLAHIPDKLSAFANFLKSTVNVKWIKWQTEGNQYLPLANTCPFCSSPIEDKKETILEVAKEYDAKGIEHLVALQTLIERLGKYFSLDSLNNINEIIGTKASLKKEEIAYLVTIKNQTDTLKEKLVDARNLSFYALRDVEKVKQRIENLKINLALLPCMKSDETTGIVTKVNEGLDAVLAKAGKLEGEINKQKKSIEKTIAKYKDEINQFLRFAGYKYSVDVEPGIDSYKMKLRHEDFDQFIENGANHLSYGEKNAFSLVLFMYECLTKNADLVILDDPISSFDKTKKFAILEMLFRGKVSFQGKTVLMLTHDIEPVIDLIKSLGHTFQPTPVASFMTFAQGVVFEQKILKSDVLTFAQICEENIQAIAEDILKLIYLRRHYEILNEKGDAYQLLANLLHKRITPTITENEAVRPMTPEEIAVAAGEIRGKLPAFDYAALLPKLQDKIAMKAIYAATMNRYEKLQLCRIICDESAENHVVRKYINEAFHIENEYVMQLNPHKYDFVPEHIARECDGLVAQQ